MRNIASDDESITGRAYTDLRDRLLACRLVPGQKLNITELQRDLSASQAAVREALSRLASEGLVEIERHRGFRAAPISADGLNDLEKALLTLEIPLLKSAMENGDLAWESRILATYHSTSRTLTLFAAGEAAVEAYSDSRREFHEAVFSASDSEWLRWAWRLLYAQFVRYRHTYDALAKFEVGFGEQHRMFNESILARDIDRATELWVQNTARVTAFLLEQLQKGIAQNRARGSS
jgi:GntR family carbon starvation induced transcriptional regulator